MAVQRNDDRHRVAENAADALARCEAGEAVQVAEVLEVSHPSIVTLFPLEEKSKTAYETGRI